MRPFVQEPSSNITTHPGQSLSPEDELFELDEYIGSRVDSVLRGTDVIRAIPYIKIPERKKWTSTSGFLEVRDGFICLVSPDGSEKQIEAVGPSFQEGEKVPNTLDRELVSVLKWHKDDYTSQSTVIRGMRNMIIRSAADPSVRLFIARNRNWSKVIETMIKDSIKKRRKLNISEWEKRKISQKVEEKAGAFYNECWNWFQLTAEDMLMIQRLSWEWKNPARYIGFQATCRSWVIIHTFFALIDEWGQNPPMSS
jgi:predicted DNA-binding antitoxin AbrB/MazE fold protein